MMVSDLFSLELQTPCRKKTLLYIHNINTNKKAADFGIQYIVTAPFAKQSLYAWHWVI